MVFFGFNQLSVLEKMKSYYDAYIFTDLDCHKQYKLINSAMNTVIKAKGLYKTYGHDNHAINDVSLEISSGEVLGVMGPSGSGKSTLIRTFNGLEAIDYGELEILGIPLNADYNERNIRSITLTKSI